MTTALVGGEGSASLPSRSLPPAKTPYPLYSWLGGPQDRSGQVGKISPPPGFDPRTVQPVAIRYTDCAIPAPCSPVMLISMDCHSTRAACPPLESYIRQHQFYSITILTALVTPHKLREFITNTSNNSHRWGILNVRRGTGP